MSRYRINKVKLAIKQSIQGRQGLKEFLLGQVDLLVGHKMAAAAAGALVATGLLALMIGVDVFVHHLVLPKQLEHIASSSVIQSLWLVLDVGLLVSIPTYVMYRVHRWGKKVLATTKWESLEAMKARGERLELSQTLSNTSSEDPSRCASVKRSARRL